MFINFFFAVLFFAGLAFLFYKVAKEKGWELPAGLTAFVSGVVYWFNDLAWVKEVLGWFSF